MRVGVRDTLIQFTFPALKCRFLNKLSVLSQSRSISSFFLFLSLFLLFFFFQCEHDRLCIVCVPSACRPRHARLQIRRPFHAAVMSSVARRFVGGYILQPLHSTVAPGVLHEPHQRSRGHHQLCAECFLV